MSAGAGMLPGDDAALHISRDDAALYIYGLLERAQLANPAVQSNVRTALGQGVAGAHVRLLPVGPLTVLVSDIVPGPVAQTRRNMMAHTTVLERVIACADVLPVRFGTVASSAASLAGCIAGNEAGFRSAFRDIDGRVELGLKASWREGVVFAEIIAADQELCRLRDRLRSRPATETYYERVELGRRVEAALGDRRAVETAAIVAKLAPLIERDAELRTLDEDMVLNRAFLVRRENEALFDAQIQSVVEHCSDRMIFRYIGPVPPYNFVRLQVAWLDAGAAR